MSITESNILLEMCTSRVYEDNAFLLLAANVDDTPRKLKKRANDLQNAIESDDLKGEYPEYLRPDTLPTVETILTARQQLQNPSARFVNMFFWFWPIENQSFQDPALIALRSGNDAEAYGIWNETVDCGTAEQILIAKHNLTIYTHMNVLKKEIEILQSPQKRGIKKNWETAYAHWMELHKSEDFWSYLKNKARSYDDPRLTTGFVRRMRTFLPQAITHINASIACDYLRLNPPLLNHVRRHKTLIESCSLDGVTLDSIFLPFVSADRDRITTAIEDAKRKLSRDQEGGKPLAEKLLSTTKQPLEFIEHIFGSGHTEYQELADEVAKTTMQCAIAHANKTEDLNTSSRLLRKIAPLACSKNLKAQIAENQKTVEKNIALRITNSAVELVNHSIEKANKGEISPDELEKSLLTAKKNLLKARKLAPGEKYIEKQIDSVKEAISSIERSRSHPTYSPFSAKGNSSATEAIGIANSAVELANRSIERANKGEMTLDELAKSLVTALSDLLRAKELAPFEEHIENQIDKIKKVLFSLPLSSSTEQSHGLPTYSCSSAWTGLKNTLVFFFQSSWFWIILFWLVYCFVAWIWNEWF